MPYNPSHKIGIAPITLLMLEIYILATNLPYLLLVVQLSEGLSITQEENQLLVLPLSDHKSQMQLGQAG